jgi:hypothetical protein
MQCPERWSMSIHYEYRRNCVCSGLRGGVFQNTVNTRRNCVCSGLRGGVCQYTVNKWRNCVCSVLRSGVCQYTVNTRGYCVCSVLWWSVSIHYEYMEELCMQCPVVECVNTL